MIVALALQDPKKFVETLDRLDDQGAVTQRHALEHLIFPDTFPPIVSRDHRALVLQTWADLVGPADSPEPMQMAALMNRLEPNVRWGEHESVNVYRPPYVWQWHEPGSSWTTFHAWGQRLLQDIDLDRDEREYKEAIAARGQEAAAALAAGSPEWPALLKRAFTKDNNLVAWQVQQPFLQWVEDQPDDAGAALRTLWDHPEPITIDRFLDQVPEEAARGMGARLSIASFLLSAADPPRFPQWRASAVDTAYRLTGLGKPQPPATAGERYDQFLTFLDQVCETGARMGVGLRDRLDAQSLTWALVKYEPREDWTEAERQAFIAWRSGKGTLPPEPSETILPSPRLRRRYRRVT